MLVITASTCVVSLLSTLGICGDDTFSASFFGLIGHHVPSSWNLISSTSVQSFKISMNSLNRKGITLCFSSGGTTNIPKLNPTQPNPTRPYNLAGSPIYDEAFVSGLLVTHWADPGGLLLIHLQVERGVKALQVGAGDGSAWHCETHLPKLHKVH